MAKHKGKKKSGGRKNAKRVKAGKKAYNKKGGLKSYNKSPKYKAKRRAAAKKAARTRAKNRGQKYAAAKKKKKKGGKKKKSKKKAHRGQGKKYPRLSKEQARAARIARHLAKSKQPRVVVVAAATPKFSSHQESYLARKRGELAARAAAARASLPAWWAT